MRRVTVLLVILVLLTGTGCSSSYIRNQWALTGGFLGAGIGAGVCVVTSWCDPGKGAAVGAAIGVAAGTVHGAKLEATAYSKPQPLKVLEGKGVAVVQGQVPGYGSYGFSITKGVVEEQLGLRGAGRIYDFPQYPHGDQLATVDLLAEIIADEQYGAVRVNVRLVRPTDRQVVAFGGARQDFAGVGYGYTGDFRIEALLTAAKAAVWSMRPLPDQSEARVPPPPPQTAPVPQ